MSGDSSNWSEWENLVLSEIKRLSKDNKEILQNQNEIKLEVAMLKLKAAMWGAITGGFVTTVIAFITALISRA